MDEVPQDTHDDWDRHIRCWGSHPHALESRKSDWELTVYTAGFFDNESRWRNSGFLFFRSRDYAHKGAKRDGQRDHV